MKRILFVAFLAVVIGGAAVARSDSDPPTFVSASTDGDYVVVTFSEDVKLRADVAYLAQQNDIPVYRFLKGVVDVTVDGNNDVLNDDDYLSGNELRLQLSFPVSAGQVVKVAYDNLFAENGGGIIVDSAGNALPFFGFQTVTNNSQDDEIFDRTSDIELSVADLEIDEGSTGTYTVALTSEPSANVRVVVSPYETVSLDVYELRFTPTNWSTPQTVTVTAPQDPDALDAWGVVLHYVDGEFDDYWAYVRILIDDDDSGVGGV